MKNPWQRSVNPATKLDEKCKYSERKQTNEERSPPSNGVACEQGKRKSGMTNLNAVSVFRVIYARGTPLFRCGPWPSPVDSPLSLLDTQSLSPPPVLLVWGLHLTGRPGDALKSAKLCCERGKQNGSCKCEPMKTTGSSFRVRKIRHTWYRQCSPCCYGVYNCSWMHALRSSFAIFLIAAIVDVVKAKDLQSPSRWPSCVGAKFHTGSHGSAEFPYTEEFIIIISYMAVHVLTWFEKQWATGMISVSPVSLPPHSVRRPKLRDSPVERPLPYLPAEFQPATSSAPSLPLSLPSGQRNSQTLQQ
ncbi:hypothetical protein MG293_020200 [Ovis ammon polii]|uniref:Uncharacterized protein n=1 Tax=Ovis ammon polii TaxID=230172 RepID=A0AAD4TN28_OVIAM|nr:hypothetical protein MG293_020200 [Ovis ammon polii]